MGVETKDSMRKISLNDQQDKSEFFYPANTKGQLSKREDLKISHDNLTSE